MAAFYGRAVSQIALDEEKRIAKCFLMERGKGEEIDRAFTDIGKARDGLEEMLSRLESLDVIVVSNFDRFTRSPSELRAIVDIFEEHGVEVLTYENNGGEFYGTQM